MLKSPSGTMHAASKRADAGFCARMHMAQISKYHIWRWTYTAPLGSGAILTQHFAQRIKPQLSPGDRHSDSDMAKTIVHKRHESIFVIVLVEILRAVSRARVLLSNGHEGLPRVLYSCHCAR